MTAVGGPVGPTSGGRGPREPCASTRGAAAGGVLALAVAAGASSLPTWVRATGVSALDGDVALRVSGAAAAPLVPATALVLAAAGAAVALAGRVGRWVVAAVVMASGLALVAAAGAVLADPQAAAVGAAAAQTGVDHLAGPARTAAGPWLTAAVGVVGVVVSLLLARSSARWAAPSARHEGSPGAAAARRAVPGEPDERADWDALSRGADPSADAPPDPGGPAR